MRPACIPEELRAMPAPVTRSHPRYAELARRPEIHAFCRLVTRRDFPPCILDDELLDVIERYVLVLGVEEGARRFKAAQSILGLALMRAAARNVDRLKAQGVDLWAQ